MNEGGCVVYLHKATHDAIAEEELVAAKSHCRNDGMVRPFAALLLKSNKVRHVKQARRAKAAPQAHWGGRVLG